MKREENKRINRKIKALILTFCSSNSILSFSLTSKSCCFSILSFNTSILYWEKFFCLSSTVSLVLENLVLAFKAGADHFRGELKWEISSSYTCKVSVLLHLSRSGSFGGVVGDDKLWILRCGLLNGRPITTFSLFFPVINGEMD